MIIGVVNADREVTIPLKVKGYHGHEQDITVVIDTGFNHFLTLPPHLISLLGCPFVSRGNVILADGSVETVDVYAVLVMWDGQLRSVEVFEMDATPLVGMKMIYGHELVVQAVDGGSVIITKIP